MSESALPADPESIVSAQSYEQEWFFFRYLMHPAESFPLWICFDIDGPLDVAAFGRAVDDVIACHQAMRVVFFLGENGQACQRIFRRRGSSAIRYQQVKSNSPQQFEAYARVLVKRDATTAWDLGKDSPYRLRLLRDSDSSHIFIATLHHIAFDFTALQILERDIRRSYAQQASGAEIGRSRSDLARVIGDQRRRYDHRAGGVNAEYWLKRYAIAPPVWQRAATVGQPRIRAANRTVTSAEYGAEFVQRLREACQQLGCSAFELYLCIFSWIAFHLSYQDRLAVQIIFDSRTPDDASLVGMFSGVHPLVVRRPDGEPVTFLSQVRKEVLRAMVHRHVGGEDTIRATMQQWSRWQMRPQRALTLNYLRVGVADSGDRVPGSLQIRRRPWRDIAPIIGAGADSLHLIVRESDDKLETFFEYNPESLPEPLISDIASALGSAVLATAGAAELVLTALADLPGVRGSSARDSGLEPLRDSEGAVCMHVDCAEVGVILRHHPRVDAADVRVEQHVDGGSELVAHVRTSGEVSDEELRDFCRAWPTASSFAVVPGRLCRCDTGRCADSAQAVACGQALVASDAAALGLGQRKSGVLLALILDVLPGSRADSEFWSAGGTFSAISEISRRAAASGLPEVSAADFAAPRALSAVADSVASRQVQ